MAIAPLSSVLHDRYVYTDSPWTAVHTSYSDEIHEDAAYVESDDEWSWSHTSYDDSFDYAEPTVEAAPDRQALWNAVHGNANLDDAVVTGSGSANAGGDVSLSLQRDTVPTDQGVPLSTTAVEVSVLGTDISKWEVFPDISPTLDLHLSGVPPGIQTIEVKAFSNGRVVGTTTFTVTVADKPAEHKEARPAEAPVEDAEPRQDHAAAPPDRVAPTPPPRLEPEIPAQVTPQAGAASAPVSVEAPRSEERARPAAAPSFMPVVPATAAWTPPPSRSNPAGEAYVGGQAMAAGQGAVSAISEQAARESGKFSVRELQAALGGTFDGQGGRGRPRQSPESPEAIPGDGYLQGSGAGSLMDFEGAVALMEGFQDRDEARIWQGALKSVAGGVTFAGTATVSPLLIGLGAALYEAGGGDARMARGDTSAWRTLGGWLRG